MVRLIVLIIICLLGGCKNPFKNDTLTLPQESFVGHELKIDGIYINLNSKGDRVQSSFFLYQNGVVLLGILLV